jgi:hypothetical protein
MQKAGFQRVKLLDMVIIDKRLGYFENPLAKDSVKCPVFRGTDPNGNIRRDPLGVSLNTVFT